MRCKADGILQKRIRISENNTLLINQIYLRENTGASQEIRQLRLDWWSRLPKHTSRCFLGSYPITPATDILHAISGYKKYGVKHLQAEDEIAAITSAIGAAFGGSLAVTTTSGPGLSLKTEAIGLAIMTELPLIIIDVQRAGPSTGLPTKTEQSDLMQAMYGRHGEAPFLYWQQPVQPIVLT